MFDRVQIVMTLVTGGVVLLALPLSARASEPSHTAVVRVVLTDGDTLHAARVRPASFDMVAVEIPNSKIRYLASNRVRAVLDSRGVDRTAAVLEHRETVPSPYDPEPNGREESPGENRASRRRIPALTWRGRPLAETRSFMITEFGVLARIDDDPYIGGDSRIAISFDMGWMKNISESGAVGFSGYALVSDPTTRLAFGRATGDGSPSRRRSTFRLVFCSVERAAESSTTRRGSFWGPR